MKKTTNISLNIEHQTLALKNFEYRTLKPFEFESKIRYSKFLIQWSLFKVIFFFLLGNINAQDTLIIQALEVADDIEIQKYLTRAANTSDPSTKLRHLLGAENILDKKEDPTTLFKVYLQIGEIYQKEKLSEQALKFFNKAFALPAPPITLESRIALYGKMSEAHLQYGHADSALYFLDLRARYFGKRGNYKGQLQTYQQKVNVFLENKNYQNALEYNLKIETLLTKKEDQKNLAVLYNNIGYNYNFLKQYDQAIIYFEKALELRKQVPELDQVILYTNIGIAFNNLNDQKNALRNLKNAERALRKDNSSKTNAYLEHLIATIYLNNGDTYNALKYNELATLNAEKDKNDKLLETTYFTAAEIHESLFDDKLALDFYKKHLEIRDSFRVEDRVRQQQLLQQQLLLERSEKEIRLLLSRQELQEKELVESENKILLLESEQKANEANFRTKELEAQKTQQELLLLQSEQSTKEANLRNKELQTQQAQQELILTQQRLLAEKRDREKDREISAIKQQEELARSDAQRIQAEKEKSEQQVELLKQNDAISQLEIERQQTFQQFAYGLGALLGLLLIMMLSAFIYYRKASLRLALKNKEIEREQEKSEKLLLNILPQETAQELKTTGSATPKLYKKVTVLFTDFSEFTKISESMSPEELINELNECFKGFDEIIGKYNLEKIKTMGDGYLCAGGLPVVNDTNPIDAINAAAEMQAFMQQRISEKRKDNLPYWDMRIGIHTGSVIAGVVGTQKFAYDIWGDTVNTASRMESGCENGKINISEVTYQLVKNKFQCTHRGEIEIKHGNKLGMYFVES